MFSSSLSFGFLCVIICLQTFSTLSQLINLSLERPSYPRIINIFYLKKFTFHILVSYRQFLGTPGIHFVNIVVSALHEILALSWGELPCSGSCPLFRSSMHPKTDPCIVHFLPTSVLDTQLQRLHLGLAKATETKLQPSFFLPCPLLLLSHTPQVLIQRANPQ